MIRDVVVIKSGLNFQPPITIISSKKITVLINNPIGICFEFLIVPSFQSSLISLISTRIESLGTETSEIIEKNKIIKEWRNVKAAGHAAEVLDFIKNY